jgi:hypothetical protein
VQEKTALNIAMISMVIGFILAQITLLPTVLPLILK